MLKRNVRVLSQTEVFVCTCVGVRAHTCVVYVCLVLFACVCADAGVHLCGH